MSNLILVILWETQKAYKMSAGTVQLGYCDSDVTVCLLFWNMPIIQDRDVKFPYKRYTYYLQAY